MFFNEIGDQEKIDIIPYDDDEGTYIINALSPTRVNQLTLSKDADGTKRAKVLVNEDQLSVAIGRGGQNVRLAAGLTGYEIDIEAGGESSRPIEAEPKSAPKPKRKNAEDSLLSAIEENGEAPS